VKVSAVGADEHDVGSRVGIGRSLVVDVESVSASVAATVGGRDLIQVGRRGGIERGLGHLDWDVDTCEARLMGDGLALVDCGNDHISWDGMGCERRWDPWGSLCIV
jgi:hypothetical protein